jgi:activator of HSP90 ATPase
MSTYDFEVSSELPADPTTIYSVWMSSEGHSAMTGAAASIDPVIGGAFTAWDGYIEGRTLSLEPGRRIVQSWRTSEFAAEHGDSQTEVVLDATSAGTLITIKHSGVPADQLGYEHGGWEDSYFAPMREYFAR